MGSIGSARPTPLPTGVIGLPDRSSRPRRFEATGWQIAFAIGSLVAIGLIGWATVATRPAALASSAWWPAAGIAVGLSIRFPRRWLPLLAGGVAAVTVPVALANGRELQEALWVSVAVGIETAVGALILRGRADQLPGLRTIRDLGRLLLAAAAAGYVLAILSALLDLVEGDPARALERVLTTPARHAAGILLIVPLYMALPRRRAAAGVLETVAQVVVAVGGAFAVFVGSTGLPIAFLPLVPLVWAATRLSFRVIVFELLAIGLIASVGSALNRGPFSFADIGGVQGGLMLQLFEAAMVTVALALALSVGAERDVTARLEQSEDLFRRNFDGSVAGMVLAERDDSGWTVVRVNPAASAVLGKLGPDRPLQDVLGAGAFASLDAAAAGLSGGTTSLELRTPAERDLTVSISDIGDRAGRAAYAVQFLDVTEARLARRLEREELERAAEVQRTLSPGRLTLPPGWEIGTAFSPARTVGGDFYDLRGDATTATMTIGDVMGKGVGAGMLAASARAVLRAQDIAASPLAALVRTAAVLDGDLRRSGAFVTLAQARIDLASGAVRVVDAGHGLIYVVRCDSRVVERIASHDLPLGIGDDWVELSAELGDGDALVLVSDGVLDSWGGSVAGLEAAMRTAIESEPEDLQHCIDLLCTDAVDTLDRDDVTAVAIRRLGGAS